MHGFRVLRSRVGGLAVLALAALAVMAGLASGGSSIRAPIHAAGHPQPAGDSDAARLAGTITDLATGRPIAGARVRAGGRVAVTGSDGRFALPLPPAKVRARYQVRIEAAGYSGATVIDQPVGDPAQRLDLGLPPHDPDPAEARAMARRVRVAALAPADGTMPVAALSPAERELEAHASAFDTNSDLDAEPAISQTLSSAALIDRPEGGVPAMIRVLMPDGQIVALDTDSYLKGVVPAEMGYIFRRGLEALKAQAVASRTYAATRCLPESAGDPERCEPGLDANVDTTTRTQVWRPVHYDISDTAVDATSDQAAVSGDALVPTLFFARTVGRTSDSEASPCCGGRSWSHLRSVASPDPFARGLGHGAGMSQEGAAVLAAWGATVDEIIPYYYSGTRMAPMPETPLEGPLPPADLARTAPITAPDTAPSPDAEGAESGPTAPEVQVAPEVPSGPAVQASTLTLDPDQWSAVSVTAGALADMVVEGDETGDHSGEGNRASGDAIPSAEPSPSTSIVIEGEVQRTSFPFMALGARWSGDLPSGSDVHLAIRTSRDGSTWSDWTPMLDAETDAKDEVLRGDLSSTTYGSGIAGETPASADADSVPEPGSAPDSGSAPDAGPAPTSDTAQEVWTRMLIARGQYVQPRIILQSNEPGALPTIDALELHYFNSDAGPSAPSGPLSAMSAAAVADPPVINRAAWGADERKRFGANSREIWPPAYTEPRAQIIHHTVTTNDPADPAAVVRAIYQYHAVTQGWGDIGYNFLIDHRGNIYEGRYGGERNGRISQGGHALQYNANTIGAALLGTFTDAAARPSAAAESALVELLASRGQRYAIDPVAPVTLAGTRFSHRVMGHRDALPGHTVCPGNGGYSRVPAIRNAVAVRMAETGSAPTPTPTRMTIPTVPTPTRTPAPPSPSPTAPIASATPPAQGCTNRVVDGDFERENPLWRRNRAYYTRWDVHQGQSALFIGLRGEDPDQGQTYASAVQTLRLPSEPGPVRLSFAARTQGDAADTRVVRVLDAGGAAIPIGRIDLPAVSGWQVYRYDLGAALASRAGQEIQLYFGVVNNGDGQRSYLRLDDVVLEGCPPGGTQALTPSPEATPEISPTTIATSTTASSAVATSPAVATSTPTSTPAPPVVIAPSCGDAIAGGDFEAEQAADWLLSGDQPADRVTEPVHAGAGALRLGLVEGSEDRFGYAAASQPFALPRGAVTATLSLWFQVLTRGAEDAFVVELRRPADGLRQILVGPEIAGEPGQWQRREVALPPWAAGSELELYLAVLNRGQAVTPGAITAVVVDDVVLTICRYPGRLFLPWSAFQRPPAAAYPAY
jgi:hypothetical protein